MSVKAAWVHQVQCPQISLCAQPLTSQVLVFSHVLRAVLSACKCPWKLSSKFALRFVGVPCKVPALRMRPQYHTARVVRDSLFRHFTGRLYRRVLKEGYTVVQDRLRHRSLSGPLMRSFMRISVPTVRHTEGAVLYVVSPQVVASGQSAMDACINPKP